MPVHVRNARGRHSASRPRLHLESLEDRCLLSSGPGLNQAALVHEVAGTDTLDRAQALGTLAGRVEVQGSITNTAAHPADVDWYSFTLAHPATVTLSATAQGGQQGPVLSLYNTADVFDPFDLTGHRLLSQAVASPSHPADLFQPLAAGTYYVAVSGAGDLYFHPFIADSGYPGAPANYDLQLSATDLPLDPSAGPVVLSATPAAGSQLAQAPLVVRVDFSKPLDQGSIAQDQDVKLLYNPNGTFGDGNDQDVLLQTVNYTPEANELQLVPVNPLAPGYYQVFLGGAANPANPGQPVLTSGGVALGWTRTNPQGRDVRLTFQVAGIDGYTGAQAGSDDTAATAHFLGDVTKAGLIQVAGAIGNDPAYNVNSTDPNANLFNPAAQVNLYHFQVSGSGRYALTAEVFAGRIGSPLNPGLSLFKVDPATGQLLIVGANDDTFNNQPSTDNETPPPLSADPVLYAGLTAGDYYLAVSGTGNVPDPLLDLQPGTNGIFDPNITHSGANGYTTGNYVLNVLVVPGGAAPRVTNVSINQGARLATPPTTFTVRFSEPVNLGALNFLALNQNPPTQLQSAYIKGSDGKEYHPRLISYDDQTNEATFLMLDAVPNGAAELHLSGQGSLGITDAAGNPLVATPGGSGDYVVQFNINSPPRGSPGNPLLWLDQEPNNTPASPQVLGPLFPSEVATGVVVQRLANSARADSADYYQFTVLQDRQYVLSVSGSGLPAGTVPTLTDSAGHPVSGLPQGSGGALKYQLAPGTYVVRIGGWQPDQAASVQYKLRFVILGALDNPPPLTAGPAPAIRLQLVADSGPAPTPDITGTPTTAPVAVASQTPAPASDNAPTPASPGDASPVVVTQGDRASSAPPAGAVAQPTLSPSVNSGLADVSVPAQGVAVVSAGSTSPVQRIGGVELPLDVSAGILLTRAVDSAGVRADGVEGSTVPDRVFVKVGQNTGPALERTSTSAATPSADDSQDETQAPAGPVAGTQAAVPPGEQTARKVETPAPLPAGRGPAPEGAAVLDHDAVAQGMPASSPLDALFQMNPLLNQLPVTGSLSGGGGFLGQEVPTPDPEGDADVLRWAWLDKVAALSAGAALSLTGWCVAAPVLQRRRKGAANGPAYVFDDPTSVFE